MKFVNKLSVISLLVLMFSFMNVAASAAAALQCTGTAVYACSQVKDQSTCAKSYVTNGGGCGFQCSWNGTSCSGGGAYCGKDDCNHHR